ncbi:hemerythrin domain-containing protein [Paenibacillus glycinis]|uniref:Hemerythrin-like domain-containing protein n=1 Tax=Paenibacillus glycinis TaxID=2697035 RepID=A0ABW9XZN1_9BACL|nr:hemerythrin domain-containing protein [Paenibacillus glycinis]NBD27873.1 hypothetical protein [Paenibacillus glycinis]
MGPDEIVTSVDPKPIMLQLLETLQAEHFELAQQFNQYYIKVSEADGNNGFHDEERKVLIHSLRERVREFVKMMERHVANENEKLFPSLAACFTEEEVVPSFRFSSLLMEQYFCSARSYLKLFLDVSEPGSDQLTKKELNRTISLLREGLILLTEYFKIEKQLVLQQAAQKLQTKDVSISSAKEGG